MSNISEHDEGYNAALKMAIRHIKDIADRVSDIAETKKAKEAAYNVGRIAETELSKYFVK